jgi:hypothetical protein
VPKEIDSRVLKSVAMTSETLSFCYGTLQLAAESFIV